MFITHPPRQTRHKRLVGARTATPYADTPKSHGRATGRFRRQWRDCGRAVVPRQGTVSRGGLRPKAEVLSVFRVTLFGA